MFTCQLSSNPDQLTHSITALKFASNIRDAVIKRCQKKAKKQSLERTRIDTTVQSIFQIEAELVYLKRRVAKESGDDPLVQQFTALLAQYAERVAVFKENFHKIGSDGVTFERDVKEIEKMKEDL